MLKQHRGHSGIGVWRIEQRSAGTFALRHAQRGSVEEMVDWAGVVQRLAPYFEQGGHMVDQAWQPRLVEGMTRAYLVRDRMAGFGRQAVNALYPAVDGGFAPTPGPRLYSDADDLRFQELRRRIEDSWVDLLCERVGVMPDALPLLWDADFLLGHRDATGSERYVLCEINVSSVAPFPEPAIAPLVSAVRPALASSVVRPA
ncbi:MAG: Cj0069 family protein [Rubrivivax sp.]